MSSKLDDTPSVMVVDGICDVIETSQPFGKRWGQESFTLTEDQLAALQAGKLLAIDVQMEYVAFLKLKRGGD